MSTALSGPTANLGLEMRQGVLAGFERANRAGGIHGRRLRLIALDDGYEPHRTAPNMRSLVEKENVLAVIGNVGTPTAIAALPIALERKTLFVAPVTGAGVLRNTPPDRYVINYRASYAEEIGAMIDALIDRGGLKIEDIAFFTQRDGYGDSGFGGGIEALKRHGLTDETQVLHTRYERNTSAVENALAAMIIAKHEPRAVIMVGAYGPCVKFIKLADKAGLKSIFLCVSFVGSNSLLKELGDQQAPVIVTQIVPNPTQPDLPIVADYLSDLKLCGGGAEPGYGSLEGYIAARMLCLGLEHVSGAPTRESLIDALESLGKFDLGTGAALQLDPKEHQASHTVWPSLIKNGVLTPFAWADIAALLDKRGAP